MVRVGYRVNVCSQDLNAVGEVFVKLLSTCWAIVACDSSNLECADKVLKAMCISSGGDCVVFKCRGFTIVFIKRGFLASLLGLPERIADRLVYVKLGDFTDNCCFRHEAYMAAGTVEEATRGMVGDFLRECCGNGGLGGGEGVQA